MNLFNLVALLLLAVALMSIIPNALAALDSPSSFYPKFGGTIYICQNRHRLEVFSHYCVSVLLYKSSETPSFHTLISESSFTLSLRQHFFALLVAILRPDIFWSEELRQRAGKRQSTYYRKRQFHCWLCYSVKSIILEWPVSGLF